MPLRFTLRQLEYLVAVGEAGSIALAAQRINVSSPSISAAIAQLEAEFGLPLFLRRHAHGLSLTQGGRQFMVQARAVLAAAGQLTEVAQAITGQVHGPLALGCLLTFAQVVLPQLRRGFSRAYPEVAITQTEHDQAALFEGLRSAGLDLALTYDLQIPADLEFQGLVSLEPYALMPVDHPLAGRSWVTPGDLSDHPMVLLDLPHSADYFLSFFGQAGLIPNIVERTRDLGVMRSMVANGFGYSIANLRPANAAAPDGTALAYVPLISPVGPVQLGLMMARGAQGSLTIRAFVDHCRSVIAQQGVPGIWPGAIA
jgi:DNA-binding transcriptional LysR family regulator